MNKFDSIVTGSFDLAQTKAMEFHHSELSHYHLLWGLIKNPRSTANKRLSKNLKIVENELSQLSTTSNKIRPENMRPSSLLSEWITRASAKAVESGSEEVSESDFLFYLNNYFEKLKLEFVEGNDEEAEIPPFLSDLNQLAKDGKLDPVIGRSAEIRAVMEILGRRNKNNPVLVGPAGVGKTAIVEGLALAILNKKVPDLLIGKTVYSLDLGALMAGTKFRGEFEERLQTLVKFIKDQNGEAILFIDEIHQLVGAGKTEGAMDAANLLKPALARGELRCIGATTLDEYQKHILGDSALDRRFRNVMVGEPSCEEAIEILMGVKEKLEAHHGIKISDEAIVQSVYWSDQYITNKFLPDKCIDLVDEAAAGLKLSAEAMPPNLEKMEAEIRSKKILAGVNENNKDVEGEIDSLERSFAEEKRKWEEEVLSVKKMSTIKNELESLKHRLDEAEREQNYEEAGKLKYSLIPELENQLEDTAHDITLSKMNIAEVISRQTGIPKEKILKDKQERILELESALNERVFGQKEVIKEISETLLTAFAGLKDQSKPLGSFLLRGPTGVGKTETAKALAEFLFNDENSIVRFDLSEYSEPHSVSKLIGAPAGYIGHDEGGILTEAIRRRPYSVVLFDEIEKAHPKFSEILLQILDDGRLTDNKGRVISFNNSIIMMTTNSSNLSSDFPPEVLGRIDSILSYGPLKENMMERLVEKEAELLNKRLTEKGLTIALDESLKTMLATRGYDDRFGARPLAALFNKLVVRPLSLRILKGDTFTQSIQLGWDKLNSCIIFKDA